MHSISADRETGPVNTDILIIGGGLSGLYLAKLLTKQGADFCLLEARDRFGGRIQTEIFAEGYYDLGPAWFWPGQPKMEALIKQLGLTHFEQYANGLVTFEDASGAVQRGQGYASMQGSYRLDGGLEALTAALVDQIPDDRLLRSQCVVRLQRSDERIEATCQSGQSITAQKVVLAMPPRVAATLGFDPALPDAATAEMQGIATWMAGQAKAIALYDSPFWREAGLSGDATSRRGPMVEIHDASPETGGPYALFGFIGVPPAARQNNNALRQSVIAQFARLFGSQAAAPKHLVIKDWALDPFTSTALDHQPLFDHPRYGPTETLQNLWDGSLIVSGTEMAPVFGGFLEGALQAADHTLKLLAKHVA